MSWFIGQALNALRRGQVGASVQYLVFGSRERILERVYGIDTTGIIKAPALGLDSTSSNGYEATSYGTLRAIFRQIAPKSLSQSEVFLDIGSGKGRAVIVAAKHPYTEVLGIELSKDLVEAANRNIERVRHRLRCPKVSVVAADATRFRIPDNVTTLFMYNSLPRQPLQILLENVAESLRRRPRQMTLVFANPKGVTPPQLPWMEPTRTLWRFYPAPERASSDHLERIDFFSAHPDLVSHSATA